MLNKIVLLTMLVLISTQIYAGDAAVGVVVAVRGEITAVKTDDERVILQGDDIFVNDVITTQAKSFVVIQLTDGSKLTIRPDSSIKLSEYSYNSGEPDEVELSVLGGGLRVVTGAIAKTSPENYTINTPVALMGVRGTEFSITICEADKCTEDQ